MWVHDLDIWVLDLGLARYTCFFKVKVILRGQMSDLVHKSSYVIWVGCTQFKVCISLFIVAFKGFVCTSGFPLCRFSGSQTQVLGPGLPVFIRSLCIPRNQKKLANNFRIPFVYSNLVRFVIIKLGILFYLPTFSTHNTLFTNSACYLWNDCPWNRSLKFWKVWLIYDQFTDKQVFKIMGTLKTYIWIPKYQTWRSIQHHCIILRENSVCINDNFC